MANVDDRIVSLKFDNLSFQKNVEATIQSLEKLKTSLNFTGTSKGFTDLAASSKKVDMTQLADSVDKVSQKFSAMGAIAFAALSNITNKAINSGEALAKSLSLDQVLGGLQEYNTNINSIQTIMANTSEKGTTLEQVNKALDELNAYSDKTIYNFSQMTKNIGTFTAAGVDLDTSVASIKGFSNVAAMSGANAEQAAIAMYQLSQGLATGTIRLIDWKSLQNNSVGNMVFQKYLFETGKALGTLSKVPIGQSFEDWRKAGNNFNESLQSGWLTADVMTTTLKAFTGDLNQAQLVALGYTNDQAAAFMRISDVANKAATEVKTLRQLIDVAREAVGSGWSQTFRTVFGTFEEAKSLFTGWNMGISQLISANADARNAILDEWKSLGGRNELIAGITVAFNDLLLVFRVVKNAFRDVFPRKTGAELYSITVRFRELAEKLALTGDTAKKIGNILRGFFMIFKFGFSILSLAFGVFKKIFGLFGGAAGSGLINVLSGLSTKLQEFINRINASGKIEGFFARINQQINKFKNSYLPKIVEWLKEFGDIAGRFVATYGRKLIATFKDLGAYLSSIAKTIKGFFVSAFEKVLSLFQRTSTASQDTHDRVKQVEQSFISFSEIGKRVSDVFKKFVAILSGIKNGVVGAGKFIKDAFVSIKEGLNSFFNSKAYDQMLRGVDRGLLGGLILLFRRFLNGGLVDMIGGKGVSKSIVKLINSVTSVFKTMQTELRADALLRIAKALALIAISLIALSFVDPAKIGISLGYLSVGLTELVTAIYALNKIGSDVAGAQKLALLSLSLLLISAALVTFSIALALLSAINPEKLVSGIGAMTLVIMELGWFLSTFEKDTNPKNIFAAAAAIWAMGSAMGKMASAIEALGSLSLETLGQGFAAVTAIMIVLVGAINRMPDNADNKLTGILALSIAMRIFASSIKALGNLPFWNLVQGFLAFNAILVILVNALNAIDAGTLASKAATLIALAVTVDMIVAALFVLSLAPWEMLFKSVFALAIIISLLVTAVEALNGKSLGAGELVALSGGVLLLALAFQALAVLSWGNIIAGLVAIGGVLAIVLIAAGAAEAAAPGLWALGGAMLFIGAGFALIGVGALAFAKAIEIFIRDGAAAVSVVRQLVMAVISLIPDIMKALISGFGSGFMDLLKMAPEFIGQFTKVIKLVLAAIDDILPDLQKTGSKLIKTLIDVVRERAPDLLTLGWELIWNFLLGLSKNISRIAKVATDAIVTFLNTMTQNAPRLVESAVNFLSAWINGLAQNVDKIATAATNLIVAFLTSLTSAIVRIAPVAANLIVQFINGISENLSAIQEAGANLIIKFIEGLGSNGLRIIDAAFTTLITFLNGLADSIRNHSKELNDAGWNVITAILDGLNLAITDVKNWFLGLGGKVLGWIGDAGGWLLDTGKHIVTGLWDGIVGAKDWIMGKVKEMLDWLPGWAKDLLGISSPSKVFSEIGQYVGLGLAEGLVNSRSNYAITTSMKKMSDSVVDNFQPNSTAMKNTINKSVSSIASQIQNLDEFQPTITPVLDLSSVQRGAGQLSKYLTTTPISASVSASQASTLVQVTQPQTDVSASPVASTTEIKFEQNVYAPTSLSVGEIYRQTKNQITMAKEELSIL